nr:MAG TPA: Membrane fusion protein Use1 [Caudoviricetes sp.]
MKKEIKTLVYHIFLLLGLIFVLVILLSKLF